ncbi:hypothetical protein [Metallosphaera javensis (ex Sakai et al. 2022)]|uniref:hypothetical protein n=1 Tax=Metallosphaera javensis (ex Sakai et al. 2022) TaxID=2775498 RepID=UPI0025851502
MNNELGQLGRLKEVSKYKRNLWYAIFKELKIRVDVSRKLLVARTREPEKQVRVRRDHETLLKKLD